MNVLSRIAPFSLLVLVVALLNPCLSTGQEPPPLAPPPPPPAHADQLWLKGLNPLSVEKTGPGLFRIGEIRINKAEKSISFPATVNMSKGLLEYVLVRTAGKTHESLLRTAVEPYHLQIAFLLLGFEGTDHPLGYQGDPGTPKGEPVVLDIEYAGNGGKVVKLRPEQWIELRKDSAAGEVKGLEWKYTGSIVVNNQFLAQKEGSIIALYHDPVAMIDNASPGGESDKIWFVKEGATPPVGTPVTVTVKAKR